VGSSAFCVGCLKKDSRKHASHKRMELQILSDITRGLEKSLPAGIGLTIKYDTVYQDKQRPDLLITNTLNDNIVMVEVDENQHFSKKHLEKDESRFKKFYDKARSQGRSLSVVRIVPGEKSKTSMFKTEKVAGQTALKRTNGYIQKNSENYNKYIKQSVNKITRIIGDKQSYLYKDQQVSIGPTVPKNSRSPIFSDTSSPDVSPSISRARAILRDGGEPKDDLDSLVSSKKTSPARKNSLSQSYNYSEITKYKKKSPDFKKSFKCKYHKNCEVSVDGFHRSKKSVSPPPLPDRWW
jgi:hypothetical protein